MPSITPAPDKRQQIVETADRLFRRDGYHATGIDRIIVEAGVAKMTMYRHFPGKDGLIVEVLRHRAARFDDRLDRLTAAADSASGRIEAIVGWYGRWFAREDFRGCAFAHALAEFGTPGHPVLGAVIEQKSAFRRRLEAIVADDFGRERARCVAASLFILFEGATLLAEIGATADALAGLRGGVASIFANATRP
ncbi:TetR/AcrR family transcriptional regulator [Aureimonas pseudogalii]|uniref:AcrR family transcriptional regulator n=1 Tax=Aureimonas pseudogalii TaxID=1744844 RepID=A0A7W6H6I8_9HYPH|nr:TetR/AcrR family transcriptional regulator [Aureimonas pseudogalii]MBB3999500.1 AcrR family transcriptional regulator [Aureimonas pseudogalii]